MDAREAVGLLRTMTWVLCVVGLLAQIFTTVNVTRFATSRDVPWQIAVLLDPMIGITLAGVLYVDARLASWGIAPPAWSTALRWGAGCTAGLMNTWESLWPNGPIGLPRNADPAAVLLHLTPALLLIGLAETIAAYRRTLTALTGSGEGVVKTESAQEQAGSVTTARDLPDDRPPPDTPDRPPPMPPTTHQGPDATTAADDTWPRAVALNAAVRATTGKPVSIWRLRTDLHVGPHRARQIHERLRAHESTYPRA
ncbi:extensin [Streptomyces acidiscabies]|uniref:extensin n=1 Tax=Streptomyces acidiscabies TaxID=42234 RepID=UPI0038F706D4